MSFLKDEALEVLNDLHEQDRIDYGEYTALFEGLTEVDTIRERDEMLEELWEKFVDVPMDPYTEQIEDNFLHFPHGTGREEIWHWFDERHSKGVAYLLYGDGVDRTDEHSKLVYLHSLCDECESKSCAYSKDDLVFIVTGANIAGYMEQRGEITVNDDEELTEFLTSQYELYRSEHSDEDWFEFIKNALLQHDPFDSSF